MAAHRSELKTVLAQHLFLSADQTGLPRRAPGPLPGTNSASALPEHIQVPGIGMVSNVVLLVGRRARGVSRGGIRPCGRG